MRHRRSGYNEINDVGTVDFTGVRPLPEGCGMQITVAEAWDDDERRRDILLTCGGGLFGLEYRLDFDKAEALGLLICSAARQMRQMAAIMDEDKDGEE